METGPWFSLVQDGRSRGSNQRHLDCNASMLTTGPWACEKVNSLPADAFGGTTLSMVPSDDGICEVDCQ